MRNLAVWDFNSTTGMKMNNKLIAGEDQINDNGRRLIDKCEYSNRRIMNGFIKQKIH